MDKYLQIKSASTVANLNYKMYKDLKQAHILLANTLKDILTVNQTKTENESPKLQKN